MQRGYAATPSAAHDTANLPWCSSDPGFAKLEKTPAPNCLARSCSCLLPRCGPPAPHLVDALAVKGLLQLLVVGNELVAVAQVEIHLAHVDAARVQAVHELASHGAVACLHQWREACAPARGCCILMHVDSSTGQTGEHRQGWGLAHGVPSPSPSWPSALTSSIRSSRSCSALFSHPSRTDLPTKLFSARGVEPSKQPAAALA